MSRAFGAFLRLRTPGALFVLALTTACAHPAERALEGRWTGVGVENFDDSELASATGFARGTSLSFDGGRLEIRVPTEEARRGTYRLEAIEDRRVTLLVLGADGSESELDLVVDDEVTLRWLLGDGRTIVLSRR